MVSDSAGNVLHIGDAVTLLSNSNENDHILQGDMGTVCDVNDGLYVGIDFGKDVRGHSCNGKCKENFGWYMTNFSLLKAFLDEDDCDLQMEVQDVVNYLLF